MRNPLPILAACVALLVACSEEEERADLPDGNLVPTMVTDSVNTFISDSGITRYHMVATIWEMFDEADEPYWRFPQGVDMEKFDDRMHTEATLQADSARYFTRLKLWQLDGNVRIRNIEGDKFLTQQMFWDQNTHTVYSDSFIHIERRGSILEGYGFTSNEQVSAYTVRRPTGIIPTSQLQKHD